MKKRNGLNLLLVLEAIVLVLVLVYVFVFGAALDSVKSTVTVKKAGTSSSTTNNNWVSDSVIDLSAEEEEAEEDINSNSQTMEKTLSFSDEVEEKLDAMTTEEKVAQLFVTTPEQITGIAQVVQAGDGTKAAIASYPVAGLVYSAQNLQGPTQVATMLANTQDYMDEAVGLSVFTIIEEAGGAAASPVAAVTGDTASASPAELGEESDMEAILEAATARAAYVLAAGFNTLLSPIADVATGTDSAFDALTYGSDVMNVAEAVEADVEGLAAAGALSIVRSFPGTLEITEDYSAYQAAIDAGADIIVVSALASESLTGDTTLPCALSADAASYLRDSMGFDGLLMSADLSDSSITDQYSIGEAAVMAVQAGMSLVYVTEDFTEAYEAVLEAVENGEISSKTLNNAVGRVLSVKI